MTLAEARKLVAEFFHVESLEQADAILCAALRIAHLPTQRYQGEWLLDAWWLDESGVRAKLASTRALFGHAFKVEVGNGS